MSFYRKVESRNKNIITALITKYSMNIIDDVMSYSCIRINTDNNNFRLIGTLNGKFYTIYNLSIKKIKTENLNSGLVKKELSQFVLLFRQLQNIEINKSLESELYL